MLDAVEIDFEDDLEDVMEDSDTKFVVEDEPRDDDKDKDQEADSSISVANSSLHAIVHKSAKGNDTDTQDKKKSISPVILWTILLKAKIIP